MVGKTGVGKTGSIHADDADDDDDDDDDGDDDDDDKADCGHDKAPSGRRQLDGFTRGCSKWPPSDSRVSFFKPQILF